jgi:hypothetical protein
MLQKTTIGVVTGVTEATMPNIMRGVVVVRSRGTGCWKE